MSLFLLLIFSIFFLLLIGVGISIIAWGFLLFGGICITVMLLTFGIMISPISEIIAVIAAFTMLLFFIKHKNEESAKYYLVIAFLCIGYAVFQYVTSFYEPLYISEIVINGQRRCFSSCTVNDGTKFFVPLALIVAAGIFYSIFKNNREM